uniref:Putative secreted protein n=1 Tax=Anopheles darlingi TaxID=43151 RepID=A0A2M4DIF6_ANODA
MRTTCILLSVVLLLLVVSHHLDPPSYSQWTLSSRFQKGVSGECTVSCLLPLLPVTLTVFYYHQPTLLLPPTSL